MAAIDLTRLDKQIDELALLVDDPRAFQEELHRLLSFYHRYSHRRHQNRQISFLKNYDLPEKVLSHIEARLKPLSLNEPGRVFELVNQLWQDSYYEARKLASSMLGNLPISYKDQVLETIEKWLAEPLDHGLSEAVIENAGLRLQAESPEDWEKLINRLLNVPKVQSKRLGLLALSKLIAASTVDRLPLYFRWVREFLISPDASVDKALERVVEALAEKSPQETAYLLREVLIDSNDSVVGRRMRHYLPFFDEEPQKRILKAIKNQVVLPTSKS